MTTWCKGYPQAMQYNQLVTEFCQDIVGLVREEALNALTLNHNPAPQRKTKPRKVVVKTKIAEAPAVKQYMPYVSPEIVSEVHRLLLPESGATSHGLAKMLNRGETTVRVALKHLFSQGKCKVESVGRATHYFQAAS